MVLNIIANNIRNKRKAIGYSQERLAFEAGMDRSYVGYIENAKYNVTILKLSQIAEALNVTINDLITEQNEQH